MGGEFFSMIRLRPRRVATAFKMKAATPVGDAVISKTVYALISGDFAYGIALGVNEDQADASAPVFEAIIRSLEITK